MHYRSYSAADVSRFFGSYCKSTASWVQHDYGKVAPPPFSASTSPMRARLPPGRQCEG